MTFSPARLGPYLNELTGKYDSQYLESDPLSQVRVFSDPDDREIAGFLAAGLAFGRVDTILQRLRELWERLDHAPSRVAQEWGEKDAYRLTGFGHRWVRGEDLQTVLIALGQAQKEHGSLGAMFSLDAHAAHADVQLGLRGFIARLRKQAASFGPATRGVGYLLTRPENGGACKRLNLYLRWMVRAEDGLDMGLWPEVRTDQLVMPLDTHVSRLSRYLGLTQRKTVDWKMATEVTANLKQLDPHDPVRFDFALSRLGILDACPRRVNPKICAACSLLPVCTLGGNDHA